MYPSLPIRCSLSRYDQAFKHDREVLSEKLKCVNAVLGRLRSDADHRSSEIMARLRFGDSVQDVSENALVENT